MPFNKRLIQVVKENPFIYEGGGSLEKRELFWKQLSYEWNIPVHFLKTRWHILNVNYKRATQLNIFFQYAAEMHFLKPYVTPEKRAALINRRAKDVQPEFVITPGDIQLENDMEEFVFLEVESVQKNETVNIEPVDNKPVDNKPVEKKPLNIEPVNNKPVDNKPVEKKPLDIEPVNNEAVNNKPMPNEAVNTKPMSNETLNVKPMNIKPCMNIKPVNIEHLKFKPMVVKTIDCGTQLSQPIFVERAMLADALKEHPKGETNNLATGKITEKRDSDDDNNVRVDVELDRKYERSEDVIFGELLVAMMKSMPSEKKRAIKKEIMNLLLA